MGETDNEGLRRLLAASQGSIPATAKALGITRQAANLRVKNAGLAKYAAELRKLHGLPGRRTALDEKAVELERAEIEEALRQHGSQSAAARALGIKRTRLQRAMERLGIAWPLATQAATVLSDSPV